METNSDVFCDLSEQLKSPDDFMAVLLEDVRRAYDTGDHESADRILDKIRENMILQKELKTVSAKIYLQSKPELPDQILKNTFDKGDKITLIGASKQRKSFFMLQMALCLAAGRDFLNWENSLRRQILLVQFELKENHYHERVNRLADALDITDDDVENNLKIVNARGLGISGADGIRRMSTVAKDSGAEIIIFDPLYKLLDGNENSPEAFKPVLDAFDSLAEETEAAICYVHHDAKGAAGDRELKDRGSGSSILGRDYDAAIALTPHISEKNVTIVETLLRNYRPQNPFCIEWSEFPSSYCFVLRPDSSPVKMTSSSWRKTQRIKAPVSSYEKQALEILKTSPMPISLFREQLRHKLSLTFQEAKTLTDWATDPKIGKLAVHEERGKGKNFKIIGLPDQIKKISAGGV